MRVIKVTESQSAVLTLTDDEAKALIRSGRRLASDSSWWGATDDEEGPERRQRSVIRCERDSGDLTWTPDWLSVLGRLVVECPPGVGYLGGCPVGEPCVEPPMVFVHMVGDVSPCLIDRFPLGAPGDTLLEPPEP